MNTFLFTVTETGFIAVTFIFFVWTYYTINQGMNAAGFEWGRKRSIRLRLVAILAAWTFFLTIKSIRGDFSKFSSFPPPMAVVFIVPLLFVVFLSFSKSAKEIVLHIPVQNIIRIQIFRVFVEILLWMLLIQNLLPIQMTLEGRNMDIITGLTAPLIAWLVGRKVWTPTAIILWNIAGLLLLLNVMIIAVLSLPTPFRVFMNEPANTIVTTFPFIFLPGLLVPLAYTLHVLSIRQVTR